MHHRDPLPPTTLPSGLDGLWLLLVDSVPMMARAGDAQTYLLGFKNVQTARKFLASAPVQGEPRMVVRGNRDAMLGVAKANGVVGVLVDYDPQTQAYSAATAL